MQHVHPAEDCIKKNPRPLIVFPASSRGLWEESECKRILSQTSQLLQHLAERGMDVRDLAQLVDSGVTVHQCRHLLHHVSGMCSNDVAADDAPVFIGQQFHESLSLRHSASGTLQGSGFFLLIVHKSFFELLAFPLNIQ